MASYIIPLTYDGQQVRVLGRNGEPWFVLADLCKVLGISNSRMAANRLDEADVSQTDISSSGQRRAMTIVSEPGMYDVVVRSDSPAAKPFRRWVTHEVLPQIRKTGAYGTPSAPELTGPELLARAVLEATETLRRREAQLAAQAEQLAIVGPKADAFDLWLSSNVDYSVAAASQALVKAGAQNMGRNRLFGWMLAHGWIYRDQSGQLHPYQERAERRHLTVRLGSQLNTRTGETFATTTIRVTPKGLALLARRMDVAPALVAEAIQDEEGDAA